MSESCDEPTAKRHFVRQCKEKIVDNHSLRHDVMLFLYTNVHSKLTRGRGVLENCF